MPVEPSLVRQEITTALDGVLEWPRLSGINTPLKKAIARAAREVIASDDEVVRKIADKVNIYSSKEPHMAMTTKDFGAIDWAKLFELAPEAFVLFKKVLDILTERKAAGASAPCPCDEELRLLIDDECEALVALCVKHCLVHRKIEGTD